MSKTYDAAIVGSGPNGLAAGIRLAESGHSVVIFEARDTVGGGVRSEELTLPGFIHDVCSSIHPLAAGSPFFRTLPLQEFGLEFIEPPASLAHPFESGGALLLRRSIADTAAELKGKDGRTYRKVFGPLVRDWDELAEDILAPPHVPLHPLLLARFGLKAIRSAVGFAKAHFDDDRTRALFAGCAAHSMIALDRLASAAFGLVLMTLAHSVGWCFPRAGAQSLTDSLVSYFRSLGGEIRTGSTVDSIDDLPARAVVLDLTPREIIRIAADHIPASYRRAMQNYRYGAAAFKIDYALNGPIPWSAKECREAATVHLGSSFAEIIESEKRVDEGTVSDRPFVILAQTSLFDRTRAPEGKETAWAYCHVPNGATIDMSERIESQIERFAPGFRELIIARRVTSPADLELYNANYAGGDINGGAATIDQLFTRPVLKFDPYKIPSPNLYVCSASTPPGGGVHGMCGYHAAGSVLRDMRS